MNIYYFRLNIFKEETFKGLFEKKGTLSENLGVGVGGGGQMPLLPPSSPPLVPAPEGLQVGIRLALFSFKINKLYIS